MVDRGAVFGADNFEKLLRERARNTILLLIDVGALEVDGPLVERGLLLVTARGDLDGLRWLLGHFKPMLDASFFQERLLPEAMRSQSHHIVKVPNFYFKLF